MVGQYLRKDNNVFARTALIANVVAVEFQNVKGRADGVNSGLGDCANVDRSRDAGGR